MTFDLKSRPNKLPWPPLIFLATSAIAVLLQLLFPVPWGMTGWIVWIGWTLIVGDLGLDVWAMLTMARAHTNILPNRAADRLVEAGPFAFTRNPIYLGNTLVMIGVGVVWNSLWFAGFAVIAAALVQRLAIVREEAHLALLFGDQWSAYAARVPRWIAVVRPGS